MERRRKSTAPQPRGDLNEDAATNAPTGGLPDRVIRDMRQHVPELGQSDHWQPDPLRETLPPTSRNCLPHLEVPSISPRFLRYFRWSQICLGCFFGTMGLGADQRYRPKRLTLWLLAAGRSKCFGFSFFSHCAEGDFRKPTRAITSDDNFRFAGNPLRAPFM